MKKVKNSFYGWLSKAFVLTALLFVSVGEISAAANIVNSTNNIFNDNLESVKNSAKSIVDEFKGFKNDFQSIADDLKNIKDKDRNEIKESIQNMAERFDEVRDMDFDGLKDMDSKGIQTKLTELYEKIKEIAAESPVGSSGATSMLERVETIYQKSMKLINDINNVASLYYSMPIGLRSETKRFEITIDTFRITRDTTKHTGAIALDAHAWWKLPPSVCDEPVVLSFSGKNVVLKGKGTTRIKLADSNYDKFVDQKTIRYTIVKKKVYLDIDTSSYMEFSCDGFKEIYLKGDVVFSGSIMKPAYPKSKTDTAITASFTVFVDDPNNMFFEADIKQDFKLKPTQDVVYTAHSMVVDFSTVKNAEGFDFPKEYKNPFKSGDEAYWTGFAIKELSVDLEKQFPEFPVNDVHAYNMMIDQSGVSGWFETSITTGKDNKGMLKENSTIQATFDTLSVGLSGGKISGGGLYGTVVVKALKDSKGVPLTMGINGRLYSDQYDNMNIDLKTEVVRNMRFALPVVDTAWLTLGQGTSFQYVRVTDSTLETPVSRNIFTLIMNGGLDVKNKLVTVDGLRFEGLKLCSDAPHFSAGTFSLNSVDIPSLHGLPFGFKKIGAMTNLKNQAVLQPEVYLSIISKEDPDDQKQGASVEAGFDLIASINDGENGDKPGWSITGLSVHRIAVDVNYATFHLQGAIQSFKDHPINGDGFDGDITFSLSAPQFSVGARAYFGKTRYDVTTGNQLDKPYKYWYVSAETSFPTNSVVLFPPALFLKSVSLSAYSRVNAEFDMSEFRVTTITPDKRLKFGLRAGIGFYAAQDNLVDAKAQLGMEFSSSGGLSRIFLLGKVGILGQDNKAFLEGTLDCNYDFEHNIFSLDATAKPGSMINRFVDGSAWLKFRAYKDSWYCNAGAVTNPIQLTFMEKIKATAYLMFGDSVPTMLPPLDPRISGMYEVTQSTATTADHAEDMSNGMGFAFGTTLSLECHLDKFVYADLSLLGGTDLLVARKADGGYFCSGDDAAKCKYRAKGQLYVYFDAGAGIKFRKKKFEIIDFSATASLRGEVPKPVYVEGNIAFQYSVLGGIVSGNAHAKYSHGQSCNEDGTLTHYHDGTTYDVVEDQKAKDKDGKEINEEDWE